ncbi:MAG TPA: TonB-dependent receptor [Gemmatimonadaceae bacterium]|nr:TonB-dependent receptor [Gemmatimonadaceae bacterium]
MRSEKVDGATVARAPSWKPAMVFLLGILPALLPAQEASTGVVVGRVTSRTDTAAVLSPVHNATISVVGTAAATTTGPDGRFVLDRIPAGVQTVRVRLLGYRIVERAVLVRSGDTVRADVTLEREAQLLSPIRVDAASADAEAFVSKPNVATVAVDATAMKGVPAAGEPDVVRVVQLLPGVISRNDFNTGLNVRGGEADQNLILLDGHPIYNPFHLGGLFSTFMDATVGGIELMTGAFPARFGGRLSSVLDVRSSDEARPGVHASADLSVIGATARLSGAFARERGTWSVAARRTYADAVTALFTDDIFPYHFRDLHARGAYALPGNTRIAVTAYLGKDILDANLSEFASDSAPSRASEGRWTFDWGNRVIGATITKDLGADARVPLLGLRLGESATLEQRVSASQFSTLLNLGEGAFTQRNEVSDVRLSGSLLARTATHDRSIGYEVATHRIRYASGSSETGSSDYDVRQRPMSAAVWINDLWRPSPRWLVEWGVRGEALSERGWAALSPRVSLKFFVTPEVAITAASGRVTQWMHSMAGDGPLRYFEVWLASDSVTPVATAWHWVAGAERRVREVGSVRVEAFLKRYDRVLEANWAENPQLLGDEFFVAEGRSYGADLLARWQPASGLAGWISYSYGVSMRSRDGTRWAPGHDRRHDIDVVATWRFTKYRFGARFGFATGTPYTPIVGEIARRVYDPSRDSWGTGNPRLWIEALGGARHAGRFPATHRLDLDASREFRIGGASVSPYVSVVNAYNAQNVFVYLYDYSTDAPTRRAISQFPILPSLGVRVVF